MSLFSSNRAPLLPVTGTLRVLGGEVALRMHARSDGKVWSALRLNERQRLQQWEPDSDVDWLQRHSLSSWPATYRWLRYSERVGTMQSLVITIDQEFAGQLTIGNIQGGSISSAWIGYWIGEKWVGLGVGTAAVALGSDYAFAALGLHRLEATVSPENKASSRVLENNGFRLEGLLRGNLLIGGEWRDHKLYARTAENSTESLSERLVLGGHAQWV